PRDWPQVAARQDPLLHLVEALQGGCRIRELQRQRGDHLDVRLAEWFHDARQKGHHIGVRRHSESVAAAPDEAQLQRVMLANDLLHDRRWRRRRWWIGLPASQKGHWREP